MGARPFCARDGSLARGTRFVVGARYAAEDLLGTGTHTFVYAGHHLSLGKPVAVKVLRDGDAVLAQRFVREARAAAQLNHDNTISIIDFGREEAVGVAYIVMELFSGQPLDRILRASGAMPAARAIPILVQITRSLANAHMAGVIHRDVSSRNVLVGRDDLVKLGDYGLGSSSGGAHDDIAAFGALAIEMLLGRKPASPVAMLDALRPDAPRPLRLLIEQCLAADPAARPRAAELEAQLLAIKTAPPAPVVTPAAAPIPSVVKPRASRNTAPLTRAPASATPATAVAIVEPPAPTPMPPPALAVAEPTLPPALTPVAPAALPPALTPAPVIVEPPAPRAAPTHTGQLIGAHRILGLLGKGSTSSVYLAEHVDSGDRVAIKIIAPEVAAVPGNAQRVVAEVRMLGRLEVAAIPRTIDVGVLPTGQPYTVTEQLRGESAAAVVSRGGKLSVARTKAIVAQAAAAMATVHAAGHVHGGLRPSNLFLVETDVKILDAGVAKALAREVVDVAADVAALGATAFELLTGAPLRAGDAIRIDAAPARVVETVTRMIGRQLTMPDVVAELDTWLVEPAPTPALPPSEPIAPSGPSEPVAATIAPIAPIEPIEDAIAIPRRPRWPWFAGAGAAAAIIVTIVAVASGGDDSHPAAKRPVAKLAAPVVAARPRAVAPPAAEPVAPPVVAAPEPVATPTPTPTTPPPPTTTTPATPPVAKPKTKPKHHDDAVIVDPFAE